MTTPGIDDNDEDGTGIGGTAEDNDGFDSENNGDDDDDGGGDEDDEEDKSLLDSNLLIFIRGFSELS